MAGNGTRHAIFVDPPGVSDETKAAIRHLAARIGLSLDFIAESVLTSAHLNSTVAVIVATTYVPQALRASAAPLVLLEPLALADVGLSGKLAGTDFEKPEDCDPNRTLRLLQADGTSVRIRPVRPPGRAGWAVPQGDIEVIVRDPTVKGAAMAFARTVGTASGARLAFLVGLSGLLHITNEGVAILERWLDQTLPASGTERTPIDDLDLSHTLSGEEFREWVNEHVGRAVYRRFARIASIFGVGSVLALAASGFAYIELKIGNDFRDAKSSLVKEIEDNLRGNVNEAVATTLLSLSDVNERVTTQTEAAITDALNPEKIEGVAADLVEEYVANATASKRIDELVQAAIDDDRNLQRLVDAATEKIQSEGALQEVILSGVRPEAAAPGDPSQRARALQILVFFETEERLRNILRTVLIGETSIDSELYEIALTEYTPEGSDVDDAVFDAVIDKLGGRDDMEAGLAQAVQTFISGYSGSNAGTVTRALGDGGIAAPVADVFLSSLAGMEGDGVVTALVDLALSHEERASHLGWIGLAGLGERRIEFNTRIEALKALWPAARDIVQLPDSDLTRRNFAAATAPEGRALVDLIWHLERSGELSHEASRSLRFRITREGRLIESEVFELNERLERLRAERAISQRSHSMLQLVLEGLEDSSLLQALLILRQTGAGGGGLLDTLERLFVAGELEEDGYRYLRRYAERGLVEPEPWFEEEMQDRLRAVRDFGDITAHGYLILQATIVGSPGRAMDPNGFMRLLNELDSRGEMSSEAYFRLREAAEFTSITEARQLLPRLEGQMSSVAYRQLSAALQPGQGSEIDQLSPALFALAERLLRLERSLAATSERARPVVDATLKNAVLVALLPPADDPEVWADLLAGLEEIEPDPTIERRRSIITLFSQRARTTPSQPAGHSAYDLLAEAVLRQDGWHDNKDLVDVLTHSIENCPFPKLPNHVEQILRTSGADHAVLPLAAALRRWTDQSAETYADLVGIFRLGSAPQEEKELFVHALEHTLDRDRRPRLAVLRGAREALEATIDEDSAAALDLAELVLDVYLDKLGGPEDDAARITTALELSGLAVPLHALAQEDSRAVRLFDRLAQSIPWIASLEDVRDFDDGELDFGLALADKANSTTAWYRLPDTETQEYWLHVKAGQAEITIVDHNHHEVIRTEILRPERPVDVHGGRAAYLRIRATAGDEANVPNTVTFESRDKPPTLETGNSLEDAKPIEVNVVYRGTFDEPRFVQFDVEIGGHYTIETDWLSAEADTDLRLLGANDVVLSANAGFGGEKRARIDWIATETETVRLEIAGRPGRFDLVVRQSGVENVAPSQVSSVDWGRAPMLAELGRIVPIEFEDNADYGWVGFMFEAGSVYRVAASETVEISHAETDRIAHLEARADSAVAFLDRPRFFLADAEGEHRVKIERASGWHNVSLYVAEIDPTAAPEHVVAVADATMALETNGAPLPPSEGDGWLVSLPDPVSFLPLDLMEGQTYSLALLPVSSDPLPTISLHSADELESETVGIGFDRADLVYAPPESGRYLFQIEAADNENLPPLVHVLVSVSGQ